MSGNIERPRTDGCLNQEEEQESAQKTNESQSIGSETGGEAGDDHPEITLRLLDLSDMDDYMLFVMDDKVSEYGSWDPGTLRESIVNYIVDTVTPHPYFRAVCLNGQVIGDVQVTPMSGNSNRHRAEIGYAIRSKYWGKGIGTRTVKMVASTIFAEWPHLERLEAIVDVENTASQRVLEKSGFQREGVLRKYLLFRGNLRDMVMFSLLSTDARGQQFS